jgi:hypothetical protein
MRKPAILLTLFGLILLAVVVALWRLARPREVPTVQVGSRVRMDAGLASNFDAAPRRKIVVRTIDAGPAGDAGLLQGTSPEFSRRVDEAIPNRFRAAMVKCDRTGLDPDASITLGYQLHIRGGQISATNVRVIKSDVQDSALEQCMLQALLNTRWIDAELPNFTEESQLFIRLRSMDKYLDPDEQVRRKEERGRQGHEDGDE